MKTPDVLTSWRIIQAFCHSLQTQGHFPAVQTRKESAPDGGPGGPQGIWGTAQAALAISLLGGTPSVEVSYRPIGFFPVSAQLLLRGSPCHHEHK